ncbi:MAG TPA: radical SAM protein, partial [Clostridia bacterium]|nr:radical SAM protein [Clostridia bacterium]
MKKFRLNQREIDSVELKCLVVSRGLKVDREVYQRYSKTNRLDINPLACNCFLLSDGTVVQLTDMGFHLKYLSGMLSWSNLKLLRYASQLTTPFSLRILEGNLTLFWENEPVDVVSLPPYTDFFKQTTASGRRILGNAVLQGLDWVAFQCLWPCEFGAAGKPCQFCFSGADFENLAKRKLPLPGALPAADVAEIVTYAAERVGVRCVQLTGGSTFDGKAEAQHIRAYLQALSSIPAVRELLLYVTPPKDFSVIDAYFALGASRIACSLEVWDLALAREITPGKIAYTTRERHLDALSYISETYGPGKAFSNFIIGIEGLETLKEGAAELARRGVLPSASVWMPM